MSAEFKTFAKAHFEDKDDPNPIFSDGDEYEGTNWWDFHCDKQRRKALVALERARCDARTAEVESKQRMCTTEWGAKVKISDLETSAQIETTKCEASKAIKVARAPYSWIAPTAWAAAFAIGAVSVTVAYIFKPF